MSIEFKDISGSPRSIRELEEALEAIQIEIVSGDHSAILRCGSPAVIQYIVISDAIKELLAIRRILEARRTLREVDELTRKGGE